MAVGRVGVLVDVAVRVDVAVAVGVLVGGRVAVAVGVLVCVGFVPVGVALVGPTVGVVVAVGVPVGVTVAVAVVVAVEVAVGVVVGTVVSVGVCVGVGSDVSVGVAVGVGAVVPVGTLPVGWAVSTGGAGSAVGPCDTWTARIVLTGSEVSMADATLLGSYGGGGAGGSVIVVCVAPMSTTMVLPSEVTLVSYDGGWDGIGTAVCDTGGFGICWATVTELLEYGAVTTTAVSEDGFDWKAASATLAPMITALTPTTPPRTHPPTGLRVDVADPASLGSYERVLLVPSARLSFTGHPQSQRPDGTPRRARPRAAPVPSRSSPRLSGGIDENFLIGLSSAFGGIDHARPHPPD